MANVSPSPEAIHDQLERILASENFAHAKRLSRFLRYIVEKACADDDAQLKEFVIGVEVFDRDQRFDPRLDSVVRVEAGRLRSKLSEYYARAGADDAIVIRVPRGGYVPVFEWRQQALAAPAEQAPPASARRPTRRTAVWAVLGLLLATLAVVRSGHNAGPRRPMQELRIAVFPFSTYSDDAAVKLLAAQITEGVTRELAGRATMQVISHLSAVRAAAAAKPLRDVARDLRADVIVAASLVRSGDKLRLDAVLVDTNADRKFWVGDFNAQISDLPDLQRRIAEAAAGAVAAHAEGAYWARGW